MIVEKGLYGLRSSAARFHDHLAQKLTSMGFVPSKADGDLWMRPQDDHWEYVATYVDDILAISRDAKAIVEQLRDDYILKGVGEPEFYLGADIQTLSQEWTSGIGDQPITTALSSETYIKRVTERFELLDGGKQLPKTTVPMAGSYHPEEDTSEFVTDIEASKFRGMIGSANWLITLGRFDINYAVNALSRYSTKPRKGHLDAMRKVLGYLKRFNNGRIIFDHTKMRRLASVEKSDDEYFKPWQNLYPDAQEEVPEGLFPEAKGRSL